MLDIRGGSVFSSVCPRYVCRQERSRPAVREIGDTRVYLCPFLCVVASPRWFMDDLTAILIPMITLCALFCFWRFNERKAAYVTEQPIQLVGYSSYCMYLFHRPLYELMKRTYLPQGPLISSSILR